MEKIQPSACSVANNEKGSPDTGLNIQNCPSAGSAPSKPPLETPGYESGSNPLRRGFCSSHGVKRLSSICAVSMVELITRTKDSLVGVRYCIEGEREADFSEIGAPEGTTILVRDLFYNTPARKKFLKTPATEGGYIADLMEHMALSRPDISFTFQINRQTRQLVFGIQNHILKFF